MEILFLVRQKLFLRNAEEMVVLHEEAITDQEMAEDEKMDHEKIDDPVGTLRDIHRLRNIHNSVVTHDQKNEVIVSISDLRLILMRKLSPSLRQKNHRNRVHTIHRIHGDENRVILENHESHHSIECAKKCGKENLIF